LRDVVADDEKALMHDAERAVFDRVLDLGWTPERFGQIEKGRSGRGRDDAVERVGEKYQWIGLYEVLGRIADHHDVRPAWSDEGARPYERARLGSMSRHTSYSAYA
jgi:hypothetical protein